MTDHRYRRRARCAVVFLFGLLVAAAEMHAHELGTLRTTVTFEKQGRYTADIIVDREHLPPGFSASAPKALPLAPVLSLPAGFSPDILATLTAVLYASQPSFDGRVVIPDRVDWVDPNPRAAELHLRLAGPIPPGARAFAWTSREKLGTYLLTVQTEGEAAPQRMWLEGGETSAAIPVRASVVPPTRREVIAQYLRLGYTHILPKGTDHILFVLGIFFLARRLKPVLIQVTAFTIAHTITLALTIYGVVSLRPAIVEPLIALSIVYVAVENIFTSELNPWRVALVFAFGLVHGMGFAGVLSELGLPRSEFLPALVSFNVGVELGQLTVILAALLAVGAWRKKAWYRARVVVPASLAIAAMGLFWALERIGAIRS